MRILPREIKVVRSPVVESSLIFMAAQALAPFLLYMPDPMRGWAYRARRTADKLVQENKFDLLYSRAQPFSSHLLAEYVRSKYQIPWIAHFSDPLVDNPYFRFWANPQRRVNESLERRIVERANEIHFVSRETVALVSRRYPPETCCKFRVVPHSFDTSLYPKSISTEGGKRTAIAHVGSFTGARNPINFLKALAMARGQEPNLFDRVVIRWIGKVKPRYHKIARDLGLGDLLEYTGPVPYLTSLAQMVEADQLLLIDAPFETESVFFPSKLVDYFGAARPIIAVTPRNGASARLLEEAGIQSVAEPNDIPAIAKLLIESVRHAAPCRPPREYDNENVCALLAERCRAVATGIN